MARKAERCDNEQESFVHSMQAGWLKNRASYTPFRRPRGQPTCTWARARECTVPAVSLVPCGSAHSSFLSSLHSSLIETSHARPSCRLRVILFADVGRRTPSQTEAPEGSVALGGSCEGAKQSSKTELVAPAAWTCPWQQLGSFLLSLLFA